MSVAADTDDSRMTFMEHLEELRTRIFRAGLAIIGGMAVGWVFRETLMRWLLRPLEVAAYCHARTCRTTEFFQHMMHPARFAPLYAALPQNLKADLQYLEPTEGFVTYFKLASVAGVLIASPMIFYQLWAFVAPGLYDREKRLVLPFVFGSTALLIGGALFGYYLVFPIGHEWFLSFTGLVQGSGTQIRAMLRMSDYIEFTAQMLLAFGVVFEMPLFIFFLALAGIVTSKQLFKFGRYFTVIAFVLAAVLTPSTDVYSQVMLAVPLVTLYFLAAALAAVFGPKEARGFRQGLKGNTGKPE